MITKVHEDTLASPIAGYRLGETTEEVTLTTREDNRIAALTLVTQATRKVTIFSPYLDAYLYNNRSFVAAISALARRSKFSEIRIVINDNNYIVKNGHLLISLNQRLASSIHIRRLHLDSKPYEEFLIADHYGVLHRNHAHLYEGMVNFKAPLKAKKLLEAFDSLWISSEPDPELRRLQL